MCAQQQSRRPASAAHSRNGSKGTRRSQWRAPSWISVLLVLLLSEAWVSPVAAAAEKERDRTRSSIAPDDNAAQTGKVPDQLAVAASRAQSATNQQRRSYDADAPAADYAYSNLELNLVRPESDPLHAQITAKYSSNIGGGVSGDMALDDAQTAEEYVAKAMQMHGYGARLREPIRAVAVEPQQLPQSSPQQQQEQPQAQALVLHQHQQQLQQQQQEAPKAYDKAANYDYYAYAQQQQQQQQQQLIEMQQHHQQQQQQQQQQQLDGESDAKLLLEAKLRAQLQAQQQQQQQQQPVEVVQYQIPLGRGEVELIAGGDPARSYEVYDESGGTGSRESGQAPQVERYYRTKYLYQPPGGSYRGEEAQQVAAAASGSEERVRVSASTEIPKAEIMKQIEKSVIKYMKELEAEGKIITAPQEAAAKAGSGGAYYKVLNVPVDEPRHVSSTTIKPKFATTAGSNSYHSAYNDGSSSAAIASSTPSIAVRHHAHHHQQSPPQHQQQSKYYHKASAQYQAAEQALEAAASGGIGASPMGVSQDMTDALAPNVEFIYKIKTRAPLQTATVKTVSKPYTLPLKSAQQQQHQHQHHGSGSNPFDHSAAIKNMEDFDLSHVVTQEPDERPVGSGSKPHKLYFNADVYQDINSLPYKPEKGRLHGAHAGEYRKVKLPELSPDYKGYSGYFAEPATAGSSSDEGEKENADDGYPLMNPYQYVLKKEPTASLGEESWEQLPHAGHGAHHGGSKSGLYAVPKAQFDYDSYSPKFNNNPDGYGYQHTYKPSGGVSESHGKYASGNSGRHSSGGGGGGGGGGSSGGKRGKRGGGAAPHTHTHSKKGGSTMRVLSLKGGDVEANLALRPPPKGKV